MIIELENVGALKSAKVEIGGITVIAGRNSTGKSTVGKALVSVLNSFIRSDEELKALQQHYLSHPTYQRMFQLEFPEITDILALTKDQIDECLKKQPKNHLLVELINLFDEPSSIFGINFRNNRNTLFGNTYFNILKNESKLFLSSNDEKHKTMISSLKFNIGGIDEPTDIIHYDQDCTMIIEKAFLINSNKSFITGKTDNTISSIIVDVLSSIETIINGSFKIENNNVYYQENINDTKVLFHLNFVAEGVGQFAKIFQFIKCYPNISSTLLIFDEPEIHLHPAWQLKMAEVLVLIAKKLYIPLLINTHSDILLKGLAEYSTKYDYKYTKFYHAKREADGCVINEVKSTNLIDVYDDLASPYDELIDLVMEND